METTLHHQLKEQFREPGSEIEVKLGRYRIDVVNGDRLVEIQQSGLSAIRDKVQKLLQDHEVDVVKPLVTRKRLIKLSKKNGKEVSRRWSPKRANILSLFDELIYFTRVFPHPNLRLIVPLIEIEEIRFPGHGRRRRWRLNDFQIKDRILVATNGMHIFEKHDCLHRLLPDDLPKPFDTAELARCLKVRRFEAQRIGYVLRKTGAAREVGKRGNALLYELVSGRPVATKKKPKKNAGKKTAKKVAKKKKAKRKRKAA